MWRFAECSEKCMAVHTESSGYYTIYELCDSVFPPSVGISNRQSMCLTGKEDTVLIREACAQTKI